MTPIEASPPATSADSLPTRFQQLVHRWKQEAGPSSSVETLAMHPAYQRIIGLGPDAVPLLLAELEREPDHWFWALRAITGENPVLPEHRGKLRLMADDWLAWGKQYLKHPIE